MSFCGNIIELIEQKKVMNDRDFLLWNETNIEDALTSEPEVEVYIEQKLLEELSTKPFLLIDVAIGNIKGEEIGYLFFKKNADVYG
jgi:hypothetical protein